jgi:hypothetical protein
MEKASHQNMKLQLNLQTKNPPYQDPNPPTPVTMMSPRNETHFQLTQISVRCPHYQPENPQIEPNPQDIHHQTHITLALLLFAKNNNRPQQIWRLWLLRLQQQQLLFDHASHQQPQHQHQQRVTLDLNGSPIIYTTPCAGPHQTLEDLEDLEDLVDLEDQEYLKDPLQQHQQQETPTTGLWGTFPKYSTEKERTPELSSTIYWDISEQTPESQASIRRYEKYPSCSPSYKDHK